MNNKEVTIAASILTADFLNLKSELDRIVAAKIPAVHFDVMDNNFVPNLSFGPKILSDVAGYLKTKNVAVDCHLMVALKSNIKVADFLQPFLVSGVTSVTLHYEALSAEQLKEFLNWKVGTIKKGLAISPQTEINNVFSYLDSLDLVLIMSVEPGFGKQKFIETSYQKIKDLSNYIQSNIKSNLVIAVDGGVNDSTAKGCIDAGAKYLVSGSYLLNSDAGIQKQVEKLVSSWNN